MALTYSRQRKFDHSDTILYEIDMLRFATERLVGSNWQDPRDAWVYLESFLIHYRSLIEFLGKEKPSNTDVHVTTLAKLVKGLPPARLKEIHAMGTQLLTEYEPKDAQGGGRISQYLQHCTTKRVEPKDWPVGAMTKQIEPLLAEVEKHLRPGNGMLKPVPAVDPSSMFSASTATATITPAAAMFDFPVRKWPV
jgi:hypothetical protein